MYVASIRLQLPFSSAFFYTFPTGQTVHLIGSDTHFEVGNYLGGGAAGTVYEAGR